MFQSQDVSSNREPTLTAVVLASIMSVMVAGLYLVMRMGLDATSRNEMIKVLGLALLVMNLPVMLHWFCQRFGVLGSLPSLAVLTLAGVAGLGWCVRWSNLTEPMLGWGVALAGYGLAALNGLLWLMHRRVIATIIFVLFAVVTGLSAGFMVYSNGVHDPLLVEKLQQGNYHHGDPYYHAALANMLDTHGVSSTGLDGLVPVKYHVGSHWFLIVLGHLVGIGPLAAHQMLFPILFVPWFAWALLILAHSCRSVHQGLEQGRRYDVVFWVVFMLGFLGTLPLVIGMDMRLCLLSTSVSESHVMSLALLATLVAICLQLYGAQRQGVWRASDLLVLLLMIPGLLAYLTFTKISVPMVMLPVAVVSLLRLRLYRQWGFVAALIITGGLCALIFQGSVTSAATQQQKSFPLAYVFYVIPRQWWGLFFPTLLLWSGWYVWTRCRQSGIVTFSDFWRAVKRRSIVDVELVLATVIIGFGPAMLYAYDAIAYFFDYQRWIGLGVVLGCLGWWRVAASTQGPDAPGSQGVTVSSIFVSLLLLCLLIIQGVNAYQGAQRYTLEMLQARASSPDEARQWVEEANVAFRRFQVPQIVRMIRQAGGTASVPARRRSIDLLAELGRLSRQERRETMVYIPKRNREFWEMLKPGAERQGTAFLAPALSGMVQLEGIPEYDPSMAWNYLGFDDYHVEQARPPQKPWREDVENLKKRVREKGFWQLIIVDQDESGKVYRERIDCRSMGVKTAS